MSAIKLRSPHSEYNTQEKVYRDGTELEKGVVITNDFLERNEDFLLDCLEKFTAYPDIYLDIIKPESSTMSLFPYQRLFLRACMRYRSLYITAARATSKTFLSIIAKYLQCVFIPNNRTFIVAPNKAQAAKIAKQKIEEIWAKWPLLEKEIEKSNMGKDYVDLYFKNGSKFSIVGALDSDRGIRNYSGMFDEVRDLDGEMISQVVLPQLNVSRRMINNEVNPYETTNQQTIFCTSAGSKTTYAYQQLIEIFQKAIIDPKSAFVLGLDWRIPAIHGLIDKKYVRDLKMSPAYDELTFAAEYMSQWQGNSDESWFNFNKIQSLRKLKNPEWAQKYRDVDNIFYLISVDVGRLSDASVACIWRVSVRDNRYYSSLVNMYVLGRQAETKTFTRQAIDLKKLIELYNPREVVIDCNGLGLGLADEMIKTQEDGSGQIYPPYGFFNNDDYKKIQPKDCPQILYSMKANGPLNSQIHGNAYSRINSGLVRFLVSEQEARAAILSTQKGQKMTLKERVQRLMPHELTTKLFDEMANLRLKRTGLDITLEQINTRYPKDKYSAFAYGLWRIKQLEEEAFSKYKKRRPDGKKRQLIFFTGGT